MPRYAAARLLPGFALAALLAAATSTGIFAQASEAFDLAFSGALFGAPENSFLGERIAAGGLFAPGDAHPGFAAFAQCPLAGTPRGGLLVGLGSSPHGLDSWTTILGESGDRYGYGRAFGDFDDDGVDELAVGRYSRTVGGDAGAGDVVVLSLATGAPVVVGTWSQDTAGVLDSAEPQDSFGEELVVGDWNGDGVDDLAIGVPGETINAFAGAGAVNVLYGSAGVGLTGNLDQFWNQDIAGVVDAAEFGDAFGRALASGDLNCDGFDDLVVGAPRENDESVRAGDAAEGILFSAGLVHVFPGSASGLTTVGSFSISEADFAGESRGSNEYFGSELATGNLVDNSAGCEELAIAAPGETVSGFDNAGKVLVWSPALADREVVTRALLGETPSADSFGTALAVGNLDGRGFDDLVIGAPGVRDLPGQSGWGAVYQFLGDAAGLSLSAPVRLWARSGVELVVTPGLASVDAFGSAVALADLNQDSLDDLLVGAPTSGAQFEGAIGIFFSALFAEDFEGADFGEWSSAVP